jgi:hypothetical protein
MDKQENKCLFKVEKHEDGIEISIQGNTQDLIASVAAALDANENIEFVLKTALLFHTMKDEQETSDKEEMNMDQVLSAVFNDSNIGKA